MNHADVRRLLPAFADRQLNPLRRFLLGRHIAHCAACLAELESLHALRNTLRTTLTVHRAPPGLATRIGSALPREAIPVRTTKPRRGLGFGGTALAGGFAGVALTLAVTQLTPKPDPFVADLVGDHVRSMMADHLTDVPTSDQHTVKPWLSARLNLSPVVKDLAAEGFPLVGGRLDYVDGHPAAALVYRRDRHVINVFAFVGRQQGDAAPHLERSDGFNVIRWSVDGVTYAAVSDVEEAQLMMLVRLIRA